MELIAVPRCWSTLGTRLGTHQCLDHLCSLAPHLHQELIGIDCTLVGHPLQHAVQEDVGAGAADPRTAVHQQGWAVLVVLPHSSDEPDQSRGELGHAMIRPAEELEVGHLKRWSMGLLDLGRGGGRGEGREGIREEGGGGEDEV